MTYTPKMNSTSHQGQKQPLKIYFDAAFCMHRDESEGAILCGTVARYWRKSGFSTSPRAEMLCAILAVQWAYELTLQMNLNGILIVGDNHQAIARQTVKQPDLVKLAKIRDNIMNSFEGGSYDYIEHTINPADYVIREVRKAHNRGLPTPSEVKISSSLINSPLNVIEISSVPTFAVGSNSADKNLRLCSMI